MRGERAPGLVEWSQASRAMWLHMPLLSGFNGYCTASPLRRCANTFILSGVGWVKHEEDIDNTAGLEEFAARKVCELE